VHLPFCVVKCTYCDFYSLAGQDGLAAAYVAAAAREIAEFPDRFAYRPPIGTIYIGGGTPTHLPAGSVGTILDAIAAAFALDPGAEITVEANPESAESARLDELRAAGANRLSIGAQSFSAPFLTMMGRPHGPEATRRAVEAARRAGFANVSLDLIYGLPGQSRADWVDDLDHALRLRTEHLSAYLLETDKDTPLARSLASGALEEPDAGAIEALFAETEARLSGAGMVRYEVSNWARPGRESRHNLGYWLDRPYIGFGSSSHSYFGGRRWACRLSAAAYIDAVGGRRETREALDGGEIETRLAEAVVTAMRLASGADFDALGRRYGVDLWGRHEAALDELARRGWARIEPPRVRLTTAGILWSMEALAPFVAPAGGGAGGAAERGAP
jgi:oxygen-independent coproporphyrinogen-3 oxidase